MTKVCATSSVYGPSCVVTDTDQEAIGRSEIVSARVVDKREKRSAASSSSFIRSFARVATVVCQYSLATHSSNSDDKDLCSSPGLPSADSGRVFSYFLGSTEMPLLGRFLLLTQLTAPAFFVAAMSTVLFLLLWFVFQDVAAGNRQKPAKTSSSGKELSGTASGVTLTTDLGSDDSGRLSDDDVPNQEQQDLWPAAEYSPPGSFSTSSGGRTGRESAPSVVGQYVDISGDGDSGGSDGDKGMGDVEGGYQTGLGSAGNRAGVQAAFHVSAEDEAKHRDVVGRETSTLEEGGWLARKLRLHLPSRGDMLIYGGFLLNVSTKGTISCFEIIGAAYAIINFSLTNAEAGSIFAACGAIDVVTLLSMRLLCKHFNDIQLVLGGMSLMIVTCAMLALPPTFIGLNVFIAAVFLMYSVGYPIGHTAVLGLFSKVVGAQPQGALMGWFGSAGALARTCFPVLAGVLCEVLGTSALFLFLVAMLSVTIALLFAFRRPYLDCIEITSRRKAAVGAASPLARAVGK